MTENNSYKSIFKATSLFGSVQILSIIISIIKSKLVALWIGTVGFGIISIFNTSISLITSITNLGLQSSAVRDIAASSHNDSQLSTAVTITKKLALYTSLAGAFLTVVLSPVLSKLFFHTYDYTISFILLSVVIYCIGMYNQYYAVLQGTRRLKELALSSLFGVLGGLVLSIPCFFIFREKGIIPSLLISALLSMSISYWYVKKQSIVEQDISFIDILNKGKSTVKLGIFIALSNNVTFLTMFLLKAYISNISSVEEVGLFQAGWSLNAQYIGLILTAMSKDYYPRLCKTASDDILTKKIMTEQGEVGLLLLVPMLIAMLTFVDIFIRILYTDEFLTIVPMTKLLLLGTIVQIAGWGLGYVFLAKNDGKQYFINEVGSRMILFPLYFIGYSLLGLEGLGYAFILNNIFYFMWISIAAYRKYHIIYSKGYFLQFAIVIIVMISYFLLDHIAMISFPVKILFCIISAIYSIYILNSKIDFLKRIQR